MTTSQRKLGRLAALGLQGSTYSTELMDKHRSLLQELAHGLRDTLSPIRSAVDLMRLRGFDAQISRSMAERIERGLDGAIATIDAFVMADQYENGTVSLSIAPIALEQLLQLTQESLPDSLRQRCVFMPAAAPVQVMADEARSVQVLGAMAEHAAAAASPHVPIEVRGVAEQERGGIRVSFLIDPRTAVGEAWFENYRARGGGKRMALRTARRIMQLQQGGLTVVCAAPDRCELLASLPQAAGQAPTTHARAASPERTDAVARGAQARHTHIVIVDDSPEVRRAYREGLTALGYQVTEISDAEAALRDIDLSAPAVALIDIHLPGMNGFQLARVLKTRAGSALRLVMLSGMTLDETMLRESKSAGFDQCFDKAAGPKALHALLCGLP